MASFRPSLASRSATPVFCADSLEPVLTAAPKSAPWAGAAGPEGAAPGTAVGLPPTPHVVVVVLLVPAVSVVPVELVVSVVPVAAVVSAVPVVSVVPVAAVVAVTSAPAGVDVGATTAVTVPATERAATRAAAPARRRENLRTVARAGTIGKPPERTARRSRPGPGLGRRGPTRPIRGVRLGSRQRPAQRPATTVRDIFALIREVPARRPPSSCGGYDPAVRSTWRAVVSASAMQSGIPTPP